MSTKQRAVAERERESAFDSRILSRYVKSVICDTSQVLMWPYVDAAVDGLTHHALRAVSSAARVVKTCAGRGGGDGGGGG